MTREPGALRPARVRLVLLLTENWTMTDPRDLRGLVAMARTAEDAGFDAVMLSEHVVLGPAADRDGAPTNPRDYALPFNQPPTTPWPSPLLLMSAIAAITDRLRLIASAIIAPLRHPLLLAQELATLDLLSEGRLVVQPTVSWLPDEYRSLDVAFHERGARLDEHLAAWQAVWTDTPASFAGRHYAFDDVYLQPKPYRPSGPPLWFGGEHMHEALIARVVRYGSGFNPLGTPSVEGLERLAAAMNEAGRSMAELEMMGGTRGEFPDANRTADLGAALASIPDQVERGYGTICIKPSQFIDDAKQIGPFCHEVVRRVEALVG